MKLAVSIACFNEKATILKAIEEAKALPVDKEIIIIDNASTDGTQELLRGLNDNSLTVILKRKNLGVGHSVKMAISLVKGEYLYSPCADLEYRMSDVLEMLKKLEEEDLDAVFGSRLLKKNISKWQLIKERPFWIGTILATFLVNILYKRNFTDVIAPKLIKTSVLKDLRCQADSQAFEFELASRLCKRGYKIEELPIYYKPRTHKEGKTIRVFDMLPALLVILKVRLFG